MTIISKHYKNQDNSTEKSSYILDTIQQNTEISEIISSRGFFVYVWISRQEFQKRIKIEYLAIMQKSILYLILSLFIGGIFSYYGIILSLVIGYSIIFIILLFRIFAFGKIYTKFASITLTDTHIVSGENIYLLHNHTLWQSAFTKAEELFYEKIFHSSQLDIALHKQKDSFKNHILHYIDTFSPFFQKLQQTKEGDQIQIFLLILGTILSISIAISYYIGLPILYGISFMFSWIFQKILLHKNHTEYSIQKLFTDIDALSHQLYSVQKILIKNIQEAKDNQWIDNLSGKITQNFSELNTIALQLTQFAIRLKSLLENSKYQKIFHFQKYHQWVKQKILEPISELHHLLSKQQDTLQFTQNSTSKLISNTQDADKKHILKLQENRLQSQYDSLQNMKNILEGYQKQLYF